MRSLWAGGFDFPSGQSGPQCSAPPRITSSSKARKQHPHEHRQRTTGLLPMDPILPRTVRPPSVWPMVWQSIAGNGIPRPRGPPISEAGTLAVPMSGSLQSGHSISFPALDPTAAALTSRWAAMISSVSNLCRFKDFSTMLVAICCRTSRSRRLFSATRARSCSSLSSASASSGRILQLLAFMASLAHSASSLYAVEVVCGLEALRVVAAGVGCAAAFRISPIFCICRHLLELVVPLAAV